MNAGSSTSYRRGTQETTEWEDIQRKMGNLPPLEKHEEEEDDDEEHQKDELEGKNLEQLDELEEEEYSDSRIIHEYRKKRMAELKALAEKKKFGHLIPLEKADFVREVSEGSKPEKWVVVLLYKDSVPTSRLVEEAMQEVAQRHSAAKFMKIVSDECIPGYPDRNVPTVLIYYNGECQAQLVGSGHFGGSKMDAECLEWTLAQIGAVTTELTEDPRPNKDKSGGRATSTYARADIYGEEIRGADSDYCRLEPRKADEDSDSDY
eukprot:gb/GECG01003378.1/.p1 GENE.gb/GECG01003378.1/~~gb/GECG01003378.1/.p1  ORF type:complete len:263 (+),score=61.26 gb/GECG01003378.1/:1-789(+)